MKRSKSIRLVLIGGLSASALSGCGPSHRGSALTESGAVYTNNQHVPGVGYYHAPFRAWYAQPYNFFDPQTRRYFHGGQWSAAPYESITNLSEPTADAARQAQAQRTDVRRGGFGSTGGHHFISS